MTISPAQAFLLKHRATLEDAGFVPVVYGNRTTVSFIKSVAVESAMAQVLQGFDEIPENLHDIFDDDFSLMHTSNEPQPAREANFIVVEIAADGMVKRMNGVGGQIEGPFALESDAARKILKTVGAELPLMDAEMEPVQSLTM